MGWSTWGSPPVEKLGTQSVYCLHRIVPTSFSNDFNFVRTMAKKTKSGRKSNRGRGQRVSGSQRIGSHLPMVRDQQVMSYTIRYASLESTITLALTLQPFQLVNSLFCHATGVHSVMSVIQALKIVRVEAWCPPGIATSASAGGSAYTGNTLRLGWVNSGTSNPNFGRDQAVTDTSMGIDCCHAVLRPQPRSASAMWQGSGGNQPWMLFYSLPPASVMDIHLKLVLNMQESATTDNSAQSISASPANGILYNIPLVGTSGQLFPQCGDAIS